MIELLRILVESAVKEKERHVINAAATGTVATTGGMIDGVMSWLPVVAVFVGLCVSCAIFYKTYLEIRIAHRRLDHWDGSERRKGDRE